METATDFAQRSNFGCDILDKIESNNEKRGKDKFVYDFYLFILC